MHVRKEASHGYDYKWLGNIVKVRKGRLGKTG